jgi:hypothetical protein
LGVDLGHGLHKLGRELINGGRMPVGGATNSAAIRGLADASNPRLGGELLTQGCLGQVFGGAVWWEHEVEAAMQALDNRCERPE